jgi:Flp pilus assembly protein CpaB
MVTVLTRIVLQNIKVLAVGEDIDPLTISQRRRQREAANKEESAFGGRQEDSQQARGVVTLMVSPSELELLALASQEGKLDVALRNPNDKEIAQSTGATPETLVGSPAGTPAEAVAAAADQEPGPMSLTNRASRPRAERRSRGSESRTQITRTSSAPKEEPKGVIIHRAGDKQ